MDLAPRSPSAIVANRVADLFGTVHESILVGPEVYIKRLAELSACRDGPVSQPADVAIAEMSRVARQSVKVALSGEGADEIARFIESKGGLGG